MADLTLMAGTPGLRGHKMGVLGPMLASDAIG